MDIQAYTQRGRTDVQAAQNEALTRNHQQITSLHIMSALLQEKGGLPRNLLQMAGGSVEVLNTAVEKELSKFKKR